MVNIKKDDVDFLKKFVIELNDWLAFEGFDKNYNLNKIGLRVQEIYDYVYINNDM